MGWFDEQIKQRKLNDQELTDQTFLNIASAVTGEQTGGKDMMVASKIAICQILEYYGYKSSGEVPPEVDNEIEQMEYLLRPFGVMRRRVHLTEGWYTEGFGPLITIWKDTGEPVALLPIANGYYFYDGDKYQHVGKHNAEMMEQYALCFYQPFPVKALNAVDLIMYAIKTRRVKDYVMLCVLLAASTGLGLLMPKITQFLYSTVIEEKSLTLLFSTIVLLICVNISTILFKTFQSLFNSEFSNKMDISVQAATMMRVLSLPPNFFRKYSSGDLSARAGNLTSLTKTLNDVIFNTGLTSLFSLVYIGSIFKYAPSLVIPAITIIIVTLAFSLLSTLRQTKISKKRMENDTKLAGLSYAMVSGIQKIRLAGAEKRAFARWGNMYATSAQYAYHPPLFLRVNGALTLAISLMGTWVMYFFTLRSGIAVAEYAAFSAAYGMVFGAFSSLASIALTAASINPVLEMAKPIMETVPEISNDKEIVTHLNGNIEINGLSFRYSESTPYIVDDMSLKINEGDYVAIVGKTGCGKSTLIRLLLGFETAPRGEILYDSKSINSLDLQSLRRHIGVVLQDGKLFQGDIATNIKLSEPQMSLERVWEAAEVAGIANDIREMPMGMQTMISEGSGGVSGGQKQRILIARAIAPNPKILIFDEATSALDNITQKNISEALDKLDCTRIIIAHRLSTIKHCDRIMFLDEGKIKEEGTYDELLAMNGLFAELVERQRLDIGDDEQ